MFEFVDRVVYINLGRREDRRKLIENELSKITDSSKVMRFEAFEHANGAIGCSLSHIAILELAIQQNWTNVLIIEDDAVWNDFDNGYKILEDLIQKPYDVILLGATFVKKRSKNLISAQCSHSYLVNKHYYATLLQNFKEGLQLLQEKTRKDKYSLDQYWKKLMPMHNWFVVEPCLMIQSPNYSDVLSKNVNYLKFFNK